MFIFAGCQQMHSFVFGSGVCHFGSFWKIWLPPTYGLKHAAACRSMPQHSKFFLGIVGAWQPDKDNRFPHTYHKNTQSSAPSLVQRRSLDADTSSQHPPDSPAPDPKRPRTSKSEGTVQKEPAASKAKGPPSAPLGVPNDPKASGELRRYLLKSEPHEYSVDDLMAEEGQTGVWDGVRNLQVTPPRTPGSVVKLSKQFFY